MNQNFSFKFSSLIFISGFLQDYREICLLYHLLGLRQYKNGLISVKDVCFEIGALFLSLHGKGESAPISKQTYL